MNIYQKLAIATTGTALTLVTVEANPVQAAIVTYNFDVDVATGSLAGTQGSGFFSYDDSTLTGNGLESLGVSDGLSISFDFLGRTYTEADEAEEPDDEEEFPFVNFRDGNLLGLNYLVDNRPSLLFAFAGEEVDVEAGRIGDLGGNVFVYDASNLPIPPGGVFSPFEGVGTVTYQPVPESGSSLGILSFGILGASLLLKRNINTKKAAIRP